MSQISAFNPAEQGITSTLPSQFSKMSTEDFIRIIFTELSNQDPLAPSDSKALLEQISSIRSIESELKLTSQLQSLVTQNQLAAAGNLIGKFIGGLSLDNIRVAGYVVAIIRQGDSVTLELDNGWLVPMSGVEQVIDPSQIEIPDPPGDSNNPPPTGGTNNPPPSDPPADPPSDDPPSNEPPVDPDPGDGGDPLPPTE